MNNKEQTVNALSGLHNLLGRAVSALQQSDLKHYYLIATCDSGPPVVYEFEDVQQCLVKIRELQEQQQKQPEDIIYIQLFEGKWWQLVKGFRPGLRSGEDFIPLLEELPQEETVDVTGSLLANVKLSLDKNCKTVEEIKECDEEKVEDDS